MKERESVHNLPNSLNGYKVTYVKMARLLTTSRRFVQEHFLSFILLWTLSITLGVVIGIARRKWIRDHVLQLIPR
jgi:NhaP-type Na+/H+ or K+/H+ antiporter